MVYVSYLIIELEDSGQPVQGIQPKKNNYGKAQIICHFSYIYIKCLKPIANGHN